MPKTGKISDSSRKFRPPFSRHLTDILEYPPLNRHPVLLLNRLAWASTSEARHLAKRLYQTKNYDPITIHNFCRRLPQAISEILPADNQPFKPQERKFAETAFRILARTLSVVLHCQLHSAFDRGLTKTPPARPQALRDAVAKADLDYARFLQRSKKITAETKPDQLADLLIQLCEYVMNTFTPLLTRTASTSQQDPKQQLFLGLRLSMLGRRFTLLAAALLMLQFKLRDNYARDSVAKKAATLKKLRRRDIQLATALATACGRKPDTFLTLAGKLDAVHWQERPEKSFSIAHVKGTSMDLLLPYKSLAHVGVSPESSFWVKGRTKRSPKKHIYLEIDFEGIGQRDRDYWEDWLADLCRQQYDLYPSSLNLEWEYPALRHICASGDLYSRLT